jgi:demethylspheroidene O-methyltransferase
MKTLDLAAQAQAHQRKSPLADRLGALLDRWMTSAALYRWSVANPLTRWMTRRRVRQVFDLMAGFVYSQVLLACVRLRILEAVAEQPRSLEELAQWTRLPAAGLQRLLQSALALGLLNLRSQGRYGLGPLGAPVAGHPGIRAMIEHHAVLYQDMQDPVAMLQGPGQPGAMAEYWPYTLEGQEHSAQAAQAAQAQAEKYARYSDLMSASQPFVVDEILASYRFDDHQCVLDVGGGQGTFLSRLGLHATHLQLKLFDLPEVAALAQANFARQGLDARARAHPGSFLKDPLPQGADLVTLIRVAHDHPDADVHTLLAAIYEALPPGGTLLLSEPMAQEPGETPQGDAYFHFYLLAMGAGRLRTPRELMAMMAQAGFAHLEIVPNPMPLQTQIVIGRKCKGLPLVSGNNVNNN